MKQLISIQARFLKSGDMIFDYVTRKVQKIEYTSHERTNAQSTDVNNIHVSYGVECDVADNFEPTAEVLILIETDDIQIADVKDIQH